MRIAVVSDIHGNLTAFEAVLADLRLTSPDLIFHGGDAPHGGPRPAEVLDRIRNLGWPGVLGNTDEMLFDPESLEAFASRSPHLETMWKAIGEMAAWTRDALGEDRIAWLRALPRVQKHDPMALVHASPESTWRSPGHQATDNELESVYAPLGMPIAVYGHIHRSSVRHIAGLTVVNTGSVSLSYDGDPRAAYLLLDGNKPVIRRIEYDLEREIRAVMSCGIPHAAWVARMLTSASPQMP
jgi:predicted phosphodiesterase